MAFPFFAPALALGIQASKQTQEAAVLFGREWQNLVTCRVKEDLDLMQRLAASKTPEQVWSAHAGFWQKAAEDYWREFGTVAELSAKVMSSNIGAAQHYMEETASDLLPLPKAA